MVEDSPHSTKPTSPTKPITSGAMTEADRHAEQAAGQYLQRPNSLEGVTHGALGLPMRSPGPQMLQTRPRESSQRSQGPALPASLTTCCVANRTMVGRRRQSARGPTSQHKSPRCSKPSASLRALSSPPLFLKLAAFVWSDLSSTLTKTW